MKQLFYACCAIFLYSCSPKLSPAVSEVRQALPDTAFVLVLNPGESVGNNREIGMISSSDNDLKQLARSKGANLVKIISSKEAKIYKVGNPKLYETKFEWSPDRKLSWEDFKATSRSDRAVAATTSCRFGLKEGAVTNEFICYQSSVKPTEKTPALLAHEQLHFDLCEVYARRLRKENDISKDAFVRMYKLYKERQLLYDEETNHGLNPEAQQVWDRSIAGELAELAAYQR